MKLAGRFSVHTRFYTVQSGGVALLDWVEALRARTAQSVRCDPDCGAPAE